jgi:hypothetical protein
MYAIVRPFLQLTLLQIGPQDLPASRALLFMVAALYGVVGTLVGLSFYPPGNAVMQTLAELAVLGVAVHLALHVRGHPERFLQTYTGLVGISAAFTSSASAAPSWAASRCWRARRASVSGSDANVYPPMSTQLGGGGHPPAGGLHCRRAHRHRRHRPRWWWAMP